MRKYWVWWADVLVYSGDTYRMNTNFSTEFAPKISIIIPVHNGANYLSEAIESALVQDYLNTEVLVIDDGSDDGGATERIAKFYGSRIRYLKKDNGGVASALNLGIRQMSGDYFSWLSHDDVYYPWKLSRQVTFLRPGEDLVLFSDYDVVDAESRICGGRKIEPDQSGSFHYFLISQGLVNGCTVLVPRRLFDEVGLFNEDLRSTQDIEMWFRLSLQFKFKHIPEALIQSRNHPEQGSRTMPNHLKERDDFFCWAVPRIPRTSLLDSNFSTISAYYLGLSLSLKKRGLDFASGHAFALAKKDLLKVKPSALLFNIGAFICVFLLCRIISVKWMRKALVALNMRLKLRQLFATKILGKSRG